MINPFDITEKDAKPQQHFETTTAGILIGFMSGKQRYKLIEEMIDSPSDKTGEVIDGFLRNGILSVAQGEELFKKAVQKGVVSQKEFETTYQKNIDDGFYVEEVKKVKEAMDAEVKRMQGMYVNNSFDRVAGAPLLGAGMLLHSFFWILTNVLASGGDFKALLNPKNNPYLWAAIGEGALALEMTSGSMKRNRSFGIGAGWLSRTVERITEKEGAVNTVKQNAYAVIGETYLSYRDFGSYLENGGAATILNARSAKSGQGAKGSELMISFDELLASEKDETQKSETPGCTKKVS